MFPEKEPNASWLGSEILVCKIWYLASPYLKRVYFNLALFVWLIFHRGYVLNVVLLVMDREGSQARFTALVAGTAAEQLSKTSYHDVAGSLQRQRLPNTAASELSPVQHSGQQKSRLSSAKRLGAHVEASAGDLVRHCRPAEGIPAGILTPAGYSSAFQRTDGGGDNGDYGNFDSVHPPPQQRAFVKLRTSKSMHQRSGMSVPYSEPSGS
jgi:hypothetical protein